MILFLFDFVCFDFISNKYVQLDSLAFGKRAAMRRAENERDLLGVCKYFGCFNLLMNKRSFMYPNKYIENSISSLHTRKVQHDALHKGSDKGTWCSEISEL